MAAEDKIQTAVQIFTVTRIFDAPRKLVFKAWTNSEMFKKWWGPRGYTTPVCKIDLRTGGKMLFCMRSPDGRDVWNGCIFREIVEPSRLVLSIYFSDEHGNQVPPTRYGMSRDFPMEALGTVTFEEYSGKTRLTLQESIPREIAERSGAPEGWNQSFDRLAEYLSTFKQKP